MPGIEVSPNGRARCQTCCGAISRGDVRVSVRNASGGWHGSRTQMVDKYHHARCYTRGHPSSYFGWGSLDRASQERVLGSRGLGGGAKGAAAPAPLVQPVKISALNPYINRWAVRARVAQKAELRDFNSARGPGKVFSFVLSDDAQGSQVKVVAFNDDATRLEPLVLAGALLHVENGRIKEANRQYNTTSSPYEIVAGVETRVVTIEAPKAEAAAASAPSAGGAVLGPPAAAGSAAADQRAAPAGAVPQPQPQPQPPQPPPPAAAPVVGEKRKAAEVGAPPVSGAVVVAAASKVLQVVNRFQDEGDGVAGTSKSQIVAHWPDTSAPSADAVQAGIASLVNSGHIFATIDDEHFRAT